MRLVWPRQNPDPDPLLLRGARAELEVGEILQNLSFQIPQKPHQVVLHTPDQGKILSLSPPGSAWDPPHLLKDIPKIQRLAGTAFSWEKTSQNSLCLLAINHRVRAQGAYPSSRAVYLGFIWDLSGI